MKKKWLIFLFLLAAINSKSQEKMKIVYVYDALCGWCYGFSPVMTQFQEKYKDSLDFEVISGGMITGNRVGPVGEVAPYISWAYKQVEVTTGVTFGTAFLEDTLKKGAAIFTSLPPAIALSVFKEMDSGNAVSYASEIQKAIYFDGIEPENKSVYGTIAAKFGLDSTDFVSKMDNPVYQELALADFKKASELNVTGFPSIFLKWEGTYHLLGSGYLPYNELVRLYLAIKHNLK